jgi:hypothetical protein
MHRLSSSVIVLILCALASFKQILPSDCYGMSDGLWIMLFSILTIVFLITVLSINIYKKVKFHKKINPLPFITFGISISIIALIIFLQSEKFKSDRILTAKSNWQELVLRTNSRYEFTSKQPEFGCTEVGTYKISKDTLYLFEEPSVTRTQYINERFLMDSSENLIVQIIKDSIDSDNNNHLKVQNKYTP